MIFSLPTYYSVRKYLDIILKEYSYPEEQIIKDWNDWAATRGESERSAKDFIWSEFNVFKTRVIAKSTDLTESYAYQKKISLDMLRFTMGEGRSTVGVRKAINSIDLEVAMLAKYWQIAEIIGTNCCYVCEPNNGKGAPLEKAAKLIPLPQPGCVRSSGCICLYEFTPIRNRNGDLLMK